MDRTQSLLFDPPRPGCVLNLTGLPGAGTIIYDRSPYGNNGTGTDITWIRLPSGMWVINFNGTSSLCGLSPTQSLDLTKNFSIVVWAKPEIIAGKHRNLVWKFGSYDFYINVVTGLLQGDIYDGAYQTVSSNTIVNIGYWYMFVFTYDAANLKVYSQGILDCVPTAIVSAANITANGISIGANASVGDIYFNGYMGKVRFLNYALTAKQINKIYESERRLFGV